MARYIDIDETVKTFEKLHGEESTLLNCYNADWIVSFLEAQPTADVQEVRSGHWILLRESEITGFNPEFAGRDPIGGYQCSNCKEVAIFDCNDEFVLSRYCPHCGAIMCKDVK